MSKQALEAMMKGVTRYQVIKDKLKGTTTPGELYRKASFEAPHRVELTKKAIKEQLIAMVTDPNGLNLKDISNNKFNSMTDVVFNNIKNALESKGFKYDTASNSFLIEGSKNNYNQISKAFNQAFGGKQAYGPFFDFVIAELSKDDMYADQAQQVSEFKKNLTPKEMKGYGFDVGHIEANITAVFKASMWNSLKETFQDPTKDFRNNEKIAEELTKLEEQWLRILNTPIAENILYEYLIKNKIISADSDYPGLIEGFLDHTIGFTRGIASGNIKATVKIESKIRDKASIQKIARQAVVSVMPEYGKANQDKGSRLEQSIISHLEKTGANAQRKLITVLNNWLSGAVKIPGAPPLDISEGSPKILDMAGDGIYENLTKGKATDKRYSGSGSTSGKAKVNNATPVKIKNPKPYGITKVQVPQLKINRKSKPNLINMVNLINMQLADTIKKNMGNPRLVNRTGRFAESAKVLPASIDRDNYIRLPYNYMKFPYQTFEVGYARGSVQRDPRKVISESIRELAAKMVLTKLRVVRV